MWLENWDTSCFLWFSSKRHSTLPVFVSCNCDYCFAYDSSGFGLNGCIRFFLDSTTSWCPLLHNRDLVFCTLIYIFGLYIDEMGLIFICNVALACYFSFNVLELSTKRRYLSLSLPLQLEKVIEIIWLVNLKLKRRVLLFDWVIIRVIQVLLYWYCTLCITN